MIYDLIINIILTTEDWFNPNDSVRKLFEEYIAATTAEYIKGFDREEFLTRLEDKRREFLKLKQEAKDEHIEQDHKDAMED